MGISRIIGAAVLLSAPFVAGAQTIDQQQVTTGNVTVGDPGYWNGQSFTPTAGTSAGAGFLLTAPGTNATGQLSIELWSAPPPSYGRYVDIPNGATMLASGTTALTSTGWYDVFWNPVTVTPGAQYFLAFSGGQYGPNGNYDAYAGGQAYGGAGTHTGDYGTNGCCDFAFREYSTGPAATTTPEPSSLALLGTSVVGLVPLLRRKRRLVA